MDDILDVDLLAFERAARRSAGRSSTACAAAWSPGSSTPATICRRTCSTAPTACSPSSSPCRTTSSSASSRPTAMVRPDIPACSSRPRRRATCPTGRRCSTGARSCPAGHPLRERYPHRYGRQVLPEAAIPGCEKLLFTVPRRDRGPAAPVPAGHRRVDRLPRVAVRRDDPQRRHAHQGDPLSTDERVTGRHARVGRRARRHQPDHRVAASDGTRPAGARSTTSGSTPSPRSAR